MLENTFLFREIHDQPQVIETLLNSEWEMIKSLANAIQQRNIAFVLIAARGTSDNAARYAQYLLGAFNKLPVALATPSLFTIYQTPPNISNALVLGISQSGASPDIISVVAEGRKQGALTAAITNDPNSPLAKSADFVINLQAGEERSVAATKTYTAELAAIAALSVALDQSQERYHALQSIPDALQKVLQTRQQITQIVPRYRYMRACVVIGRGFNYCSAFEMALKIKELTYTVVEPFSSADFLHGPFAMLEGGFPVFVIAPSGVLQDEMQHFINSINEVHAESIVISDNPNILQLGRVQIPLPVHVAEWLSPLITIVPGQLFALDLAAERDLDPDHPRSLHKVTKTR
ncbi:MAG: SIS domain-containing protein [Anaerolineales bacterium]